MPDTQGDSDKILHQDSVEDVIDAQIEAGVGLTGAAIANATAITGGESPTEAEHNALVTKLNSVLAVLRTNGIIAP
jgi:hypothetical protein